jgi:hypothetical protein
MFWSVVAQLFWLGLDVLGVLRQSERETAVEVLLLRQQLRILERKQGRPPRVSRWEKLTLAVLAARLKSGTAKGRGRLIEVMLLFKPDTVLKWHQELVCHDRTKFLNLIGSIPRWGRRAKLGDRYRGSA